MTINQLILEDLQHKIVKRSGKWVGLKCPFCGDSASHKPHLWLMLSDEQDGFIGMRCFQPKCDVRGIMSLDRATKLGVKNKEVLLYLMKNKGKLSNRLRVIETTVNNIDINTSFDTSALEYMYNRTNKNFDNTMYVNKFSYIGDVKEFLKNNWKHIQNRDLKMFKYLMENPAACFVNQTRTRLFARTLSDDANIKHVKVALINLPIYAKHAPYKINQHVDMKDDYSDHHRFYGEGLFDVINTSIHISGDIKSEFIGCSSFNAMKLIIDEETLLRPNKQEVVVKDADINLNQISNIFKPISYRLKTQPYVIYNKLGKDFGNINAPIEGVKEKLNIII